MSRDACTWGWHYRWPPSEHLGHLAFASDLPNRGHLGHSAKPLACALTGTLT